MKDQEILRKLAAKYFEAANSDANIERIKLHKAVNDLHQIRPTLLIDEIPWGEMNGDGSLTLQCENEFLRRIENNLRMKLFQWNNFPGDMVLEPYYKVTKVIHTTGIGIRSIRTDEKENMQTHIFKDQLSTEEDLEKLHFETITYDEKKTMENFTLAAEAFGDVMPVKICGMPTGYGLGCKTWDDIVNMRGLDELMFDMYDRPEFIHKIVSKMTDIFLDKIRQYEELNLFDGDAYYCHTSSALTNDLPKSDGHVTCKNLWGRGLAQILASVSPDMHDEFDIQYMIKAMKPFGLVYYGCCEPLDTKIDILRQIPNLRKICISPWANYERAAQQIGKDYVFCAKPNPAILAEKNINCDAAKKELENILRPAKEYHCSTEVLMKDITTVCQNPQNLVTWAKIAQDAVNNF